MLLICRLDRNEVELGLSVVYIHRKFAPRDGDIININGDEFEVIDNAYDVRFRKNAQGKDKPVRATLNLRRIGSL
jgi:hypothetical protein